MTSNEEEESKPKADLPVERTVNDRLAIKETTHNIDTNCKLNMEDFKMNNSNDKSKIYSNLEWQLVDSHENSSTKLRHRKRRKDDEQVGSHRFHVALLGLTIAAVNCYAQATFCIAIVEMVLPADYVAKNETNQPVIKVLSPPSSGIATSVINIVKNPISSEDQSCPVEFRYRDYYDSWRFIDSVGSGKNKSTTPVSEQQPQQANTNLLDVSDRFDWDASRQGLLLGAFAVGTAPLQVFGGRLAEMYGAKWVLLVGCIGTALTNLTIPLIARFSFILLVMNRVSMGIAQAGMEPGLMCLLAEWLTPSETGFFISMLLFAICIGFFLGSLLPSFIMTLGYGWPLTYYVSGGFNLLVGLIWWFYASSRPNESRFITEEELIYIEDSKMEQQLLDENNDLMENKKDNQNISLSLVATNNKLTSENKTSKEEFNQHKIPVDDRQQAPWMNILRTRSVWAFIICKISVRWAADVLGAEMPTYLANVLHLSIKLNGIINSVAAALFAIFSFLTGYLVNEILKTKTKTKNETATQITDKNKSCFARISKTNLRKIVQSIASFGSAILLCLMTRYDCNLLFSMSMLLLLSCCLVMGTGGELQIPYDMTSKYPGTIHGLACTMSISGWFAPPLIGLILGDQPSSRYRWSIVWYLTALINFIGGLVFVLFADASPRDFDKPPSPSSSSPGGLSAQVRANEGGTSDGAGFEQTRGRHEAANLEGYYENAACSNSSSSSSSSSADSSPVVVERRLRPTVDQQPPVAATQNNQDAKELSWEPHFDRNLIKCRQVEASFIIKPNQLDAQSVIFPYRPRDSPDDDNHDDRQLSSDGCREATPPGEDNWTGSTDGRQRGRSLWRLLMQMGGRRRKKVSLASQADASAHVAAAAAAAAADLERGAANQQLAETTLGTFAANAEATTRLRDHARRKTITHL